MNIEPLSFRDWLIYKKRKNNMEKLSPSLKKILFLEYQEYLKVWEGIKSEAKSNRAVD